MQRALLLSAVVTVILLVSGCGQSGPLYVPGNPSRVSVPPSQSTSDSASEKEEDESSDRN